MQYKNQTKPQKSQNTTRMHGRQQCQVSSKHMSVGGTKRNKHTLMGRTVLLYPTVRQAQRGSSCSYSMEERREKTVRALKEPDIQLRQLKV